MSHPHVFFEPTIGSVIAVSPGRIPRASSGVTNGEIMVNGDTLAPESGDSVGEGPLGCAGPGVHVGAGGVGVTASVGKEITSTAKSAIHSAWRSIATTAAREAGRPASRR